MKMQLGIRKIPGVVSSGKKILSRVIALVGLFFLLRALLYGFRMLQSLFEDPQSFSFVLWFYSLGLIYCFVPLALAFLCFYKLFLAQRLKIRRAWKNNQSTAAAPRTAELKENVFSLSGLEGRSEWVLGPSNNVFRTEEFLYGTVQNEKGARQVLWAIPRRIFDEEEETAFIEQCRQYCRSENAGKMIFEEGQENGRESTEASASSKAEIISQAIALCLQIFAFSFLLVALEDLPGRMAFNYWIYSVFICIFYLLIYLFTAIDCVKKDREHKQFARTNLILVILMAVLFLPIGQVGDVVMACVWSGLLTVLFIFQLRVFWLMLKRYQKGTVVFHRVFRLAGLLFFGLALIHLARFAVYLKLANLTPDSFYETASTYLAYDWMMTHKKPEGLLDCAEQWVFAVTAVCGGCLCFLVDGAVSVFQNRKNLPRLLLVIGGTALFVLCRRCLSTRELIFWCAALAALLAVQLTGLKKLFARPAESSPEGNSLIGGP